MTRIASVSVIRNAALIAIAFSFLGKFTALISTIPSAVLGECPSYYMVLLHQMV